MANGAGRCLLIRSPPREAEPRHQERAAELRPIAEGSHVEKGRE